MTDFDKSKRKMQRITLQIICYKSNRMLCKKRKMETSVKKFLKKWPHNHVFCEFCDYFWFSKIQGASSPPSPWVRPWPYTHKSHTTKIYTHINFWYVSLHISLFIWIRFYQVILLTFVLSYFIDLSLCPSKICTRI